MILLVTNVRGKLSRTILERILRHQIIYSLGGLLFGGLLLIGGVVLTVEGFTGQVSLQWHSGSSGLSITTGVVGVVIALLGVAVIWITRFKLDIAGDEQTVAETRPAG
ncbi:hypothetical protein AWC11_01615 [Mycobacterium interjectum]|nr:hypothetical protein AWC11_01615 [Mycobacterium interjectum]